MFAPAPFLLKNVSVSKVILKDHIDHCLADAVRGNDLESVEKLKKAISIFVK